ncbi:transglycosylase SLT domain-containing protein [Streptomyces sp. NPDC051840]|uniref:aggregation-promoting factor C-terminal-like domain-containing protein n=1 Tax=Streptomyces sp. NPDC051840 TaxID=3154752 RepID=UPI00342E5583
MSRPTMPDVSWRTCRIAAATVIAVILTAALLAQPADADSDRPQHKPPLLPSMIQISSTLAAGHTLTLDALQAQAAAQATAHRRTVAAAAAKHRAEQRAAAAKERAAARRAALAERKAEAAAAAARQRAQHQRAARVATRTVQAPTVTGARSYARSRLSAAQYSCLDSVIRRESGWNPRAANPSSGAYGLMQALPGSKMASAGSDWRTNPVTQIKWGLSYISSRYGTPCGAWNFWQKNRWY